MKNGKATELVNQLTTEEKISLTTGVGAWNTAAIERLDIPSVTLSDGPIGLRREQDGETLPSVCFPSISKLACSFDPSTLREVGAAIGEQCRSQNVDVLLAPGLNVKRNPRCGRNFEYYSEDPFLTAELANAYVKGVNSQGVGVCVKHFAANSQEYGRRVCDSVVDTRALREIYLSAFERVIKTSKPCAVMCAYNKLNGEYCSQNKFLLTDVLRDEWKFDGIVMSDWGATDDRAAGIAAGLDLQMPQGDLDPVRLALSNGTLLHADLDKCVARLLQFAQSFDNRTQRNVDLNYQHNLAGRISADCTVLVKNNCKILPFAKTEKIAVVGQLAEKPYFQGEGSSKVNAYRVETLMDRLAEMQVDFTYAIGYDQSDATDEQLEKVREVCGNADKVLVIVGCVGSESEGYDRATTKLPQAQLDVLDAATSANSNVAVVVQSGAPVDLSWHHSARALILDYLPGENCGTLADVVFGNINPTGRLAETWAYSVPMDDEYSGDFKRALYKESIFVGYRYFTTACVEVDFPFGYGLNYNEFSWSNIQISQTEVAQNGKLTVTLDVENLGKTEDADTVQIYLTNCDGRHFHEAKRLVAFKKVRLKGGEKKTVSLDVSVADFAWFDVDKNAFVVNGGKYLLTVAKNCNDSGTTLAIRVEGENGTVTDENLACYNNPKENFRPTDDEFAALFGEFPQEKAQPFTFNSPLQEIREKWLGKQIFKIWTKNGDKRTLGATPLIDFAWLRKDVSSEMIFTLVNMLNGQVRQNVFKLFLQWLKQRRKAKSNGKKG